MKEHRHISTQFEAELQTLQAKFAAMGGLVEEQVRSAVSAFKTIDLSLAQSVCARESQVNQFEMDIDQETTTIMARRQPTASDLRLLVGLLKSSTDLERVGDEADRIAKVTINTKPSSPPLDDLLSILEDVATLENLASQMLRASLNQFARKDESGATTTIEADAEVDQVYNGVIESCSEGMTRNPTHVDEYMAVIWVARSLERIGDHAKNIAENTIYSVQGTDVRHPNLPQ